MLHDTKKSFYVFVLILLIQVNGYSQERPVGINLTSVHDYSRELVFTNAFKQCRSWIAHDANDSGEWSSGVDVPLLPNGYPVEIPFDNGVDEPQHLRTLLLWELEEYTPIGHYRLIVEGVGKIRLTGGARGSYSTPVDTLIKVSTGSIILDIQESMIDDPISDIKFIYPEYVNSYSNQTFRDDFLDFIDDFQTIRFMDWLRTNNNTISNWAERTNKDYYTQSTGGGVAWEYIIELCNTLGKDAWINIPHRASDAYIENLAALFREQLNDNLKIYIEYSNELWNSQFLQNDEAADFAELEGFEGERWELTWQYTAKRSADIFEIFNKEFNEDSDDRLIRIIPSQAANSWLTNRLVSYFNDVKYNPYEVSADAIAIAPYFGGSVANNIANEDLVSTITVEEIMDSLESSLAKTYGWMDENNAVAENYGLQLLAYEGGQHLVATGDRVNNTELTEKLFAANRHEDMKELYCAYFDYWYNVAESDMFAVFSSHSNSSKWGSWGIKEHMEDMNAPKYEGVLDCIVAYNETITNSNESLYFPSIHLYPNPSSTGIFYLKSDNDIEKLEVLDARGVQVQADLFPHSRKSMQIKLATSGVYFVKATTHSRSTTFKVVVE